MITIQSVTRTYGDFTAVDEVSFTAHPGRVTRFLGPNGAGKSTTMRILVGLTQPTSGTATVFALSMDYHVFLLSRIRERYAQTGDTEEAVVHGIAATGRIITGAALIIVVVFTGFAAGQLVMFQQMGYGVGVALLVDATQIRMVVVPAAMTLLGRWNWYLPSWLNWMPEFHVEGDPETNAVPAEVPASVPMPV